jgi:hypothetical protein
MSNILDDLGIDPDDIHWTDLAACNGIETDFFFDTYEADQTIAKNIDQMCLVCPVAKQCHDAGTNNAEYGVWGGVYLSLGALDKTRNSHKTQEVWKKWKSKHGQK